MRTKVLMRVSLGRGLGMALLFFSGCNNTLTSQSAAPNPSAGKSTQGGSTHGTPVHMGGGENGNVTGGNNNGNDDGSVDQRTEAKLVATPNGFNFGVQSVDSLTYVIFTIQNAGQKTATNLAASGLGAPYTYRGGVYPGLGGSCAAQLIGGATCTLHLQFHPAALGRFILNTFHLAYDGGNLALPLDGTATNIATLRFDNLVDDQTFSDLGTVAYASSASKTIRVHYWGARPASGVAFSGISAPFAISSNTCQEEITSDCTLTISYLGTKVGSTQQSLKVTYNNSSYAAEDNHTLIATTSAQIIPATLTITDLGTNSFGKILINTSIDKTLQVVKGGTLPATAVSASALSHPSFSYKGGSYPGTGGTCGATITTSCSIVLTFNPLTVGSYSSTVSLSYQNGISSQIATQTVTGQGGSPAILSLTPNADPAIFAQTPVGQPKNLVFTLSNTSSSVTATALTLAPLTGPFTNQGGCGTTLGPGASCNFTVRFLPTSAGTFTNTLAVSYFDGVATQNNLSRGLSGTSTDGAQLGFTVSSYNFGTVMVGNSATATLSIQYFGVKPGTGIVVSGIVDPFSFPGGSFSGGGTCNATSIAASCTVKITFTPAAVQTYSTVFQLQYDNGNGQTQTTSVSLSGTGGPNNPAVLSFANAPSYDFGGTTIATKKTVSLTVNRTGNLAAGNRSVTGLTAPFSLEGGTFPGNGGTCTSTLSGSSCTLVVSFSPTNEGAQQAQLTLNYNDGVQAQQTSLTLTGTGTSFASLSASSGAFGKTGVGSQGALSVSITNTGTKTASSVTVQALSGSSPFSILSNSCPTSLSAGQNCILQMQFTASTPGNKTDTLSVTYFDGSSNRTLSLTLSGTGTVAGLVSVNGNHSCTRIDSGDLKCWGENNYGQLGLGSLQNRGDGAGPMGTGLPTVKLGSGRTVKALATGHWHTCAILDNDALKCWGANFYGQLGLETAANTVGGNASEMGDALPSINLGTSVPVAIAAGYSHTCALLNNGSVKCWGQNSEGQLGLGDSQDRGRTVGDMGNQLPTVDLGGFRAIQITANDSHTCALLENHSIKCWGNGFYGQLGQEDFANRGDTANHMGGNLPAIDLGTGQTATQVVAGGAFTCALLTGGKVKCWGRNEEGILGQTYCQDADGNAGLCSDSNFPLALRGYGLHNGQMGDGLPVIPLGSARTAVSLSAANSSVCAQLDDGTLKCWGANQYGQLGVGDTKSRGLTAADMGDSLAATSLGSGLIVTSFSSGNFHNCALFSNGSVKCWGNNPFGNLGLGDLNARGDAPNEMANNLAFVPF